MPNSSTRTNGAADTPSSAQQATHQSGPCTSPDFWRTAPPVHTSIQEVSCAPDAVASIHLRHIQPTRVKRSRKVCVAAIKLPPFQQAPTPAALDAAQQRSKGQPLTPTLTHPSPPTTSSSLEGSQPQLTNAARMATSPKQAPPAKPYLPSAASLLLGVRLCVVTNHGPRTGKVVDVQSSGKHKVLFDEGVCEWLSLASSRQWTWQTPRAASAGLTPALCQALRKLGAANLPAEMQGPSSAPPGAVLGPAPTSVEAAVGRQLWLWCAAGGKWHAGLVVALSQAGTGAHHVVYADGADEWVMLSHEVVVWCAVPAGNQPPLRHICPSLPAGSPTPTGEAAVNWRLGIYWREDQTFFEGTVQKYIASSGQHELVYDDGDEEEMHLDGQDLVVWRCRIKPHKADSRAHANGGHDDDRTKQDGQKRQRTSKVRLPAHSH